MLSRRHVQVLAFQQIGKEADNLEPRETIGEDDDSIEYDLSARDRSRLRGAILADQKEFGISDREICNRAKISHRTMAALRKRQKLPTDRLIALAEAVEGLKAKRQTAAGQQDAAYTALVQKREELGSDAALARFLEVSRPYVSRLLKKSRQATKAIRIKLRR